MVSNKVEKSRGRIKKLRTRLDMLIRIVHLSYCNHIPLDIDQYYYVQKKTEMLLLEEKLDEALERLEWVTTRMDVTYEEVFNRWRSDIRLLPTQKEKYTVKSD